MSKLAQIKARIEARKQNMQVKAEENEDNISKKGSELANLLGLRKKGDRYDLSTGSKTDKGLFLTIERMVDENSDDEKLGKEIAETLYLKKKKDNGRYDLSSGDKTEKGLGATIRRFIEENKNMQVKASEGIDSIAYDEMHGNKFNTKVFKTKESANDFMEKNPGYGVLVINKQGVHVAKIDDKGEKASREERQEYEKEYGEPQFELKKNKVEAKNYDEFSEEEKAATSWWIRLSNDEKRAMLKKHGFPPFHPTHVSLDMKTDMYKEELSEKNQSPKVESKSIFAHAKQAIQAMDEKEIDWEKNKELDGSYFVTSLSGDKYSPFWDVYYYPNNHVVEIKGVNGFGATEYDIEEQYGIDPNQNIYELLSELYDYLKEKEKEKESHKQEYTKHYNEKTTAKKSIFAHAKEAKTKVKADDVTDRNGTPAVGDAPTLDGETKIINPDEQETQETVKEEIPAETKTESPKVEEKNISADVNVDFNNAGAKGATALVKLSESLKTLSDENKINEAVMKELKTILKDAGIGVTAMKKAVDALYNSGKKINAKAKEDGIKIVAKAETIFNKEVSNFKISAIADDEMYDRFVAIKAIAQTNIERAGDLLKVIAENKSSDESKDATDSRKIVADTLKEWQSFKRENEIFEKVNATVHTVQNLVDNGVVKATDFAQNFVEYFGMSSFEQKKVTAALIDKAQNAEGLITAKMNMDVYNGSNTLINPQYNHMGNSVASLGQDMIDLQKAETNKR